MALQPQGRLDGHGPFGVVDIGSNSVRLVVYERLSRAPTPLFNEKALCGLGRGIGETGALAEGAVEASLAALRRFRLMADQMGVVELVIMATAAVREASNGPAFIAAVEEICRARVEVLSGEIEARRAALGILSGFHNPDGLVGDMGGGSLELVDVGQNGIGHGETLPLGGIRLQESVGGNVRRALSHAHAVLDGSRMARNAAGRDLFLVGGTWRNLARLHMIESAYPLNVMHAYAIEAQEMGLYCDDILKRDLGALDAAQSISKARRALLPFGAAVLKALIAIGGPKRIVVSALGLREGLLYERLAEAERETDPLLAAATELAILRSRSPEHGRELGVWTERVFATLGVDETEEEKRLRRAACLLSDIGWRAHPDYRGTQSLNIIAHAAFVGLDHPGRAYLALSSFYRHQGLVDEALSPAIATITTPRLMERARLLGALLRVDSVLTASMNGLIGAIGFSLDADMLCLHLPESHRDLLGDRLRKRLGQLARLIGRNSDIVIGPVPSGV